LYVQESRLVCRTSEFRGRGAGEARLFEQGRAHAATCGNLDRACAAAVEVTRSKWTYFERRARETYPGKRGLVTICAMKADKAGSCK
jgi:hypothetical protein